MTRKSPRSPDFLLYAKIFEYMGFSLAKVKKQQARR